MIVIDNLDRVNEEESLKIWSTLQTFLQRKNPTRKDNNEGENKKEKYDNIFILVPYDEEGLRKLWDKNKAKNQKENNEKKDTHCSRSFFEKSFQIRLEVPQMILSSWEGFCRDYIKESLIGAAWKEDEKEKVVNVFRWTKKDDGKSPSPRLLKTYINQVGILRKHVDPSISTEAVAYYVVEKHIRFKTRGEIVEQLKKGEIYDTDLKSDFRGNVVYELSGILHGVNPEKGKELLLGPEIEKTIKSSDEKTFGELIIRHNYAFWNVFEKMNFEGDDVAEFLSNCYIIEKVIKDKYEEKLKKFLIGFRNYKRVGQVGLLRKDLVDKYPSFLNFCKLANININEIGHNFYLAAKNNASSTPFYPEIIVAQMLNLFYSNKNIKFEFQFSDISINNWIFTAIP